MIFENWIHYKDVIFVRFFFSIMFAAIICTLCYDGGVVRNRP